MSAEPSSKNLDVKILSPSQDIIAQANQTFTITDGRGRVITLKKPNALVQLRMIDAIGESAKNDVYRSWCTPLTYIIAIDGQQRPPIMSKSQVEALVQELDDDGISAVCEGINDHFAKLGLEGDAKEALKK